MLWKREVSCEHYCKTSARSRTEEEEEEEEEKEEVGEKMSLLLKGGQSRNAQFAVGRSIMVIG